MYTLLITTNKFTSKTSYYAKDCRKLGFTFKRVSGAEYRWLEIFYKRWDCVHSNSNAKYTRHYKSVS